MATADERSRRWFGADGRVSRLRGTAFAYVCLGATLLALALVFVFLAYVANDAVQPATASTGWLLTVAATVVLPAALLAAYYSVRDPRAGTVACVSFGLPIASTLLAGGALIVFTHVVTPHEWLALVAAVAVAYGLVELYARERRASSSAAEQFAVRVGVPILAIVGVPGFGIDRTISTPLLGRELFHLSFSVPTLVPSLRGLLLTLPVLPTDSLSVVLAFTLPLAAVAAVRIRRARERDRAAVVVAGAIIAAAGLGTVVAPVAGVTATTWVIAASVLTTPVFLYVEAVVRRGEGVAGLAFPVVVAAGALLAAAVVATFGYAGPDLWLDWRFLTGSHSTTARDAGIYPALVGSILLLLVVAVVAFPLGLGAAIYLEEYAPSRGRAGRLVDLIEINIANLAGIPSVVYGVLGLALFVRGVGLRSGIVVVGGLTIALLILPIVVVSAQEAIRAVPDSLRQASYGMGATKWQTVRNVVLPRAAPGILTGTILALGRAIGETAPLLMIGVAAVVRVPPNSFFGLTGAMPRQIFSWSRLIDPDFRYGVLAAGVLTLLVVMLLMNGTAILLRNEYQRRG